MPLNHEYLAAFFAKVLLYSGVCLKNAAKVSFCGVWIVNAAICLNFVAFTLQTPLHNSFVVVCVVIRNRIYNETNIDSSFAKARQSNCSIASGSVDNNLAPLDVETPNSFDLKYFKNLLNNKGLLHSDQILLNGGSTDSLVKTYSKNVKAFYSDFVTAMMKMGDITLLTGSNGEIRKNCRRPN
ncbi:Peroxidase 4 [Hibiscus syriacus]|uniref:peroxidase n=1 Tax=Hibiscus syriacus TaxID=106335 RepID=A0A6A3C6S0_HIBSY|nr:Peroxidase 4 [Hibiscus syriacus]